MGSEMCIRDRPRHLSSRILEAKDLSSKTHLWILHWPVSESGGTISSVTLRSVRALISHLCLPGLPEVGTPYWDMWPDYQITFLHTRPCYAMSSSQSVDCQILHGNVRQVDLVQNGPIRSAAIIIMFPLRLCGGKLLVEVTRERRYGPSRLRVNDDNERGRPIVMYEDNGA